MIAGIVAFVVGLPLWIILSTVVLYFFIVGALFRDDWWFKGLLFLVIPFAIIFGFGVAEIPSWSTIGWLSAGYVGVGLVWSVFRWVIFVKDFKKVVEKLLLDLSEQQFLNDDGVRCKWASLSTRQKGEQLFGGLYAKYDYSHYEFRDHLDEKEVKQKLNLVPNVSQWQCKARVVAWVMYWPLSAINYAYVRLLKDLVDFFIERMKGVYNRIATNIMQGVQV